MLKNIFKRSISNDVSKNIDKISYLLNYDILAHFQMFSDEQQNVVSNFFNAKRPIEVDNKGKSNCVFNPFGFGNIYSKWTRCEKNIEAEYKFLYSALRRLHLKNRIDDIY